MICAPVISTTRKILPNGWTAWALPHVMERSGLTCRSARTPPVLVIAKSAGKPTLWAAYNWPSTTNSPTAFSRVGVLCSRPRISPVVAASPIFLLIIGATRLFASSTIAVTFASVLILGASFSDSTGKTCETRLLGAKSLVVGSM